MRTFTPLLTSHEDCRKCFDFLSRLSTSLPLHCHTLLPTLGRLFRPVRRKNSAAKGKNSAPLSNFPHQKSFCLWNTKRSKILAPFWPFLYKITQSNSKFVRSLYFLFGPFWVMRPNIRQIGNTAATACAWCGQTRWRHSSVTISFHDFSAIHAKTFLCTALQMYAEQQNFI